MLDKEIKINLSEEQMTEVLEGASITPEGELSVDSILEQIKNTSTAGYDIKNILKEAFCFVYDKNSSDYEIVKREIIRNTPEDNFDYAESSLFVNGTGFGGLKLEDVIAEKNELNEDTDETESGNENDAVIDNEYDNIYYDYDEIADFANSYEQYEDFETFSADDIVQPEPESFNYMQVPENLREANDYIRNIRNIICTENIDSIVDTDCSKVNTICKYTNLNVSDNIFLCIDFYGKDDVCEGFVLVVNCMYEPVILGRFVHSVNETERYYIEASAKNIDFDKITNEQQKYKVIFANRNIDSFYSTDIDLKLKVLENTSDILCIDFGTSNTTVGLFCQTEARIVKFTDTTSSERKESPLCPTLVYVNRIGNIDPVTERPDDVEYMFGYDARKILIESDYNPKGTMFFEIKRWITSTDVVEEISDGEKYAYIERKEIIRAYLEYILQTAKNYLKLNFVNLHFSAPIKLKANFINFLKKEIFRPDEYNIMPPEKSIDEGMAIVYCYVSEKIERDDLNAVSSIENDGKKSENIITIDCGGSTTDIVSCKYSYFKTDTGYKLDLETKFEKGNPNFGGNNITYRIFQFLKIKLADYYSSSEQNESSLTLELSDLINCNQNVVLNNIDNYYEGKSNSDHLDIYDTLDRNSKKSENILPTDFNGDSKYAESRKTSSYVKRNFYYLWQLAEQIKIEFFSQNNNVEHRLASADDNRKIHIDTKNLYFYIKNPDSTGPRLKATREIERFHELPNIVVNTKELTALLRPDIYSLLSSIFYFDQNKYDYINLSGQSCKINLFQDLLKEFIPGKALRSSDTPYVSVDPNKLKMDCLYGCIAYVRDCTYNRINPTIKEVSQNIIYNVFISRGDDRFQRHALINGDDYSSSNHSLCASPIHIDQYEVFGGMTTISIYNTLGAKDLVYSFNLDIYTDYTNSQTSKEIFLSNIDTSFKNELIRRGYSNIENYCVFDEYGNSTDEKLLDNLIKNIRQIEVNENGKKILIFAIPNKDGYGFVLYQIVKVNEGGSIRYYRTFGASISFESAILDKSFFNGKNCEGINISEG